MTTEEQIKMLEESREKMHRSIDEKFDTLIEAVRTGQSVASKGTMHYDLGNPTYLFKGKKPVSLTYPNGEKVIVKTWRQLALELLTDCNSDPDRHDDMMFLRNKVAGRNRWILSDSPEGMDVPLKIDEGMYFEGKFDTDYLLKMMTERIFDKVGYDYSFIEIEVRNKGQEILDDVEQDEGITMQM